MPTQNIAMTAAPVPQSDLNVDEAGLSRRMALAQMLQQQAMSAPPNETVSGLMVKQSPLQGLARLLQAYGASKMQDQVDTDQRRLVSKQQQNLAAALANPDKKLAGMELLRNPATQALGIEMIKKASDEEEFRKLLPAGFAGGQPQQPGQAFAVPAGDVDSQRDAFVQQLTAGMAHPDKNIAERFKGLYDVYGKPLSPNNPQLRDPYGTGYYTPRGVVKGMGDITRAQKEAESESKLVKVPRRDGSEDMMPESEALKLMRLTSIQARSDIRSSPEEALKMIAAIQDPKERDAALMAYANQKQGFGVSQTPAAKAASESAGRTEGEWVGGLPQKIMASNNSLRYLNRLDQLNADDKTYAAGGAEFKKEFSRFAQGLGIDVGSVKAANTEQFVATVGELLKSRLGSKDYGSGSGVSNLDLVTANVPLPELSKTRQGRQQIIDALRKDTQVALADYKDAQSHFKANNSLQSWIPPSEKLNNTSGLEKLTPEEQKELSELRTRFKK